MKLIDELVEVMTKCPDVTTRKRLGVIVRRMREESQPVAPVKLPAPKRKVTQAAHDAAVEAGRKARAAGKSRDGHRTAGSLQERNAWLAGYNDEDIRRGGK